jgi:hypothetical protein
LRGDVEYRAYQREHVGEIDIRQRNIDQTAHHGIESDVGRVETELD